MDIIFTVIYFAIIFTNMNKLLEVYKTKVLEFDCERHSNNSVECRGNRRNK